MKKVLSSIAALAMIASFASCGAQGSSSETPASSNGEASSASSEAGNSGSGNGSTTLNFWSFTDEVPGMVDKFMELNPDFKDQYKVEATVINTDSGYQESLDQALAAGGKDAPDLYCAEAAFVLKYTKGDAASYAAPYKDLGIDVDKEIADAEIANYAVEIGSNESGDVVGLGYQATGGCFIYRRSIAKDAFGTDDPAEISKVIGGGSQSWDKFFEAAETLKGKGYGIVSGDGDIWHAVENSSDQGWVVDGKLTIDPKREAFLDLSKQLKDNGYHNDTQDWTDAWYADMAGTGDKGIFGFFGPAWLINYVMAGNSGGTKPGEGTYGDWAVCDPPVGFFWGGTWLLANKNGSNKEAVGKFIDWVTLDASDTGLQYMWANGTLNGEGGTKDAVASAAVMAKSDGTLDFLGGQNMFDYFVPANDYANGKNLTQYDQTINDQWRDQVRQYTAGNKSREDAIKDFKSAITDNLDVTAD